MVTGWPNLSNPADGVFFFILGISITLLFLTTAVMVYFVLRFSRQRHPVAEDVEDSLTIEVLWTIIPTVLVLAIFFAGWKGFQYMRTVPPDAMPVKVTARQFSWTFEYENGKQDSVLRVPLGRPVKLLITSADVLHSVYIPAYRVKEDAVPGRQTYLWFLPDEAGSYDLFCTEYCGVAHSGMTTKVAVLAETEFDSWYTRDERSAVPAPIHEEHIQQEKKTARPDGAALISSKGCIACHSIDGTSKIGPGFKGLFGRKETVLRDGKELEVQVDRKFIREKMMRPELSRIKGYPPIMPSQQGQLTDDEIEAITEYIRSLQ